MVLIILIISLRTEFDDSHAFCATVNYSPKTGYKIVYWGQQNDFRKIKLGCARACYKDHTSQNGLAILEIETQSGYKNQHQAYSAGLVEGSLTWMSIYAQRTNTIDAFCDSNEKFCDWLREIINSNYLNVYNLAKEKQETDQYHHQVYLFYQQLLGIEAGFRIGVRRARQDYEISLVDILLLNSKADMEDLKVYFNEFVAETEEDQVKMQMLLGRMLLKVSPGGSANNSLPKVLIAHSSSGDYSSMLKIVKTYRFNYHFQPNNLVTNTDITFTSQPGAISSSDDFYLAHGKKSKVIFIGLPLKRRQHFDGSQLLYGFDIDAAIFSSARTMSAIRFSHNGKHFLKHMSLDPDIGVKQWLVIDEKHLKYFKFGNPVNITNTSPKLPESSSPKISNQNILITKSANDIPKQNETEVNKKSILNKNIVWLVEQTFRKIHGEDITLNMTADSSAWIFDGSPIFKQIQDFNELHRNVVRAHKNELSNTLKMEEYFEENAYRGDLQDEPELFGNIDMKFYATDNQTLLVQNGPIAKNDDEPFDWSSHESLDIKHEKHPEIWDFTPTEIEYFWF